MHKSNLVTFNERIDYNQYANSATNSRNIEFYKKFLDSALRNNITARQREMLMLHYLQGYSGTQIAQLLGVNKSTVCRTLQTTTQKLQKLSLLCRDMLS